jgi:hypothetical protein
MPPPSLILVTCDVCLKLHRAKNLLLTNAICAACVKREKRGAQRSRRAHTS